jgi:predicted DNA-binding WGR domain protein
MKQVYLENRGVQDNAECNKFFKLVDDGHQVISYWGAIGAKGQSKVLVVSDDPVARDAAWAKKFKEKTQRKANPYVVIDNNGTKVEARPSSEGRRWGLEVETHTHVDLRDIVLRMRDRGLDVSVKSDSYFKSNGQQWDVKRDGSCGYEFASPILSGDQGIFDVKLAVEKIREVCPTAVNSSCGIHVTVDVSDHSPEDIKRLVIAYLKSQEHFYAECNESRQHNHFCARNPTDRLQRIIDTPVYTMVDAQSVVDMAGGWRDHEQRYHGLNFTRLFSIKVIEFRMLESTVAIRKVGGWIRMVIGFVDGVKRDNMDLKSTERISKADFDTILEGSVS